MYESIRDTPIYQEMMRMAREEAFQEGFEQGFQIGYQKGVKLAQRSIIIGIISERFSKLARITRKQIADIEDADILKRLIYNMGKAQSIEEAMMYLIEADEGEDEDAE